MKSPARFKEGALSTGKLPTKLLKKLSVRHEATKLRILDSFAVVEGNLGFPSESIEDAFFIL